MNPDARKEYKHDMRILLLTAAAVGLSLANSSFGTWKMNASRSTFAGTAHPKTLSVRIEPHLKGEVFTVDRVESDGRATSSSTILYLDGALRDFQDFGCSGSQSSRRVDGQTLEIRRNCASTEWIWVVRRPAVQSEVLILDVTETHSDHGRVEWHVVLEKS
jgi:hypothetical protein